MSIRGGAFLLLPSHYGIEKCGNLFEGFPHFYCVEKWRGGLICAPQSICEHSRRLPPKE